MNIKRIVASTFLLFLLMLAACSSGNNNNNNQSSGNDNNSDEQVTINYYTWEGAESADFINEKIENFEEENPNIKVEYKSLVEGNDTVEYNKKLDIQTGTGQPIDVVAFSHVDFLTERAARGVLAPLDEYLDAESIDPEEEFFINPTHEGKTYGIQDESQPWFVAINKDALDEAGLSIPEWGWTWDDFSDYAEQLTTDDQYGAYFHTWGEYANFPAYSELPHPYLDEDEQPVFDDDLFADFFMLRRDMEEAGSTKTFQDAVAADLHYATEFFNEDAAMLPVGSFFLEQILMTEKYPHDFQTVIAPLPRSSEDVEVGATYTGGHYLAVGDTSEHKEESFKFALYMSQQTDSLKDFPGSINVDEEDVLDKVVGDNEDLIDKESLKNTVYDENVYIPYEPSYSASYSTQLKDVLEDGFSLFMLDKVSPEEAQEAMVEDAERIKEQNK